MKTVGENFSDFAGTFSGHIYLIYEVAGAGALSAVEAGGAEVLAGAEPESDFLTPYLLRDC